MSINKIAVIGLARTGMSVSKAILAKNLGVPIVFEQKSEMDDSAAELRELGIEVVTSWDGNFEKYDISKIIPSPGVPMDHPAIVYAQEKGIQIQSELDFAQSLTKCPVIAITGTNGKSTTTALIHAILEKAGKRAYLCGNIAGIEDEMTLTDAAMQAVSGDTLVAEVSSFQLDWAKTFRPHIAVLTNVQPDHLNRYGGDFEKYADAKFKIFQAQTSDDFAVINFDEPLTIKRLKSIPSKKAPFAYRNPNHAHFTCKDDYICLKNENIYEKLIPIKDLKLVGNFNVWNALAAIAATKCYDISDEAIISTLKEFKGLPHRMEFVTETNGIKFINNSMCTNPEAAAASINSLPGNPIVIAGGVNKGLDFSPLAEAAKKSAGKMILIGEDRAQIKQSLIAAGYNGAVEAGSLEEAFGIAVEQAKSGDIILLAPGCASFDMFRDFKHRGEVFRALALDYAKDQG